ncbi:dolichyl diphosphooligosaccharide protein [Echinococcus multilocularis]|uniref:Dolichyl-diphosphooligosaccharide--protein glycosyltransferase 48 kDa subunit n=1 Tax=Echinococcus multilocularis TaxID=6211 RepID=A0A068Y0H7_ECHMU|nr:dolichyl diphosphooligosaccharide protein [Echinococcus multilocularis]
MGLFLLCYVLFLFSAEGLADNKDVLVLIENIIIRDTHSQFFKSLTDRNYQLTFKYADDSTLDLKQFGEYSYHHVIVFAPTTTEFGGYVNVKALTDFVDNGGNVLVAGGPQLGEAVRDFASECGVEFDAPNTSVIDHHNFDEMDNGDHTLIIADPEDAINVSVITGRFKNPVLYRGVGISTDPTNPLLINILHGSAKSYSYDTKRIVLQYPTTVGKNTQLVAALQARNDARIVFTGSIEMFSDAFYNSPVVNKVANKRFEHSSNSEFCDHLLRWTFKESGVLRVANVSHHRVDELIARHEYTITDEIIYRIDIAEKDESGVWQDYVAEDIQLELVRIDPFIRRNLKFKGHGYEMRMKLPDVYGVFKLVVDYHRIGYTSVFSATQISVRPFTHMQYERFITSAYPYYASAISMMLGVFFFSFVYLYLREGKPKAKMD